MIVRLNRVGTLLVRIENLFVFFFGSGPVHIFVMEVSQDAGQDPTGLELSADFHAQVEAQTMALKGGNDKIWQVAHAALFHFLQLRIA